MKGSCTFSISDVNYFLYDEYISHNSIQDKEGPIPKGHRTKVNVAVFLAPPHSYTFKNSGK